MCHEIVRAFEIHLKAVPWKIEIELCVVMGKCSVNDRCGRALNQVLLDQCPIHVGPFTQ